VDLDEVLAATFSLIAPHLTERRRRRPPGAAAHTGLRVRAELDRGRYPLGVTVGDQELAAMPLVRHESHGEWNHTLHPAA
jgi:hypothetical protein